MRAAAAPHLPALLERHARERGARPALIVDGRAFTYGELHALSGRLAAALAARGVTPGAHVVVFVPPGRALYLLLIALFRLGAVAVFVDPGMGRERIEQALALAHPAAFVGVPRAHLLRLRSRALARVPLHLASGGPAPGALPLLGLLATASGRPPAPPLGGDTPALLTFTSGTTGRPRGALRTHGFLLAQHAALTAALGTRREDVDIQSLPVFLLHSLAAGATAILPTLAGGGPAPADPGEVVRLVRRHGATTLTGAPTFLAPIVAWCRRRHVTLPGVRAAFVGGAVVPPALVAGLRAILPHGDAVIVYGSTEAEPIATLTGRELQAEAAPGALIGRGSCVGRPTPGVRLRLDPQPGPALGPALGAVGEVLVAGAHVSEGHVADPGAAPAEEATEVRDEDGTVWHRTGDCGFEDASGRLWLVGRRGDAIPRQGGVLWPYPVEGAAEALPEVARAALVGIGGRATLALVPAAGATRKAAKRRAEERLAGLGLAVDEVRPVRSVPLDRRHRAKVDRAALAAALSGDG